MPDAVLAPTERIYSFASFRLYPRQRLLFEGDTLVRLGSRAFEILVALIERRGELVGKDELVARVWPKTNMADGNLKFQVGGLRRALGDGRDGRRYIETSSGRGYRFVAAVAVGNDDGPGTQARPSAHKHNLPAQLTRLIGRSGVVSKLVEQLPTLRLLTIVGVGGIGKTAVAVAVAEELIPAYEDGVWLIDLAPIADPRLVPTALASALRLEVRSDNPLPSLVAALSNKHMLLVLDNCEHVIDAAAALAAEVLKGSRGVHILATGREPMRVNGERLYRLLPLETPPEQAALGAADALRFSAVQLFVERATASTNDFELSDADAPSAGEVCRKLDGVPLAIELAAARVGTFGVRGLAARLDDRLQFLTDARRTAPPRHRTIGATLDWSYQLLSEPEQAVFRCLAIFAGGFTGEAAQAVAVGADGSPLDITDILAELVTKSVVTADVGDGDVRFRLLETMRAYAATKLAETGEADALARRHANYFRDSLEERGNSRAAGDFAHIHAPEIDNIRAALRWAFAPGGDKSIALTLAAASAPLWLERSLLTECCDWSGAALDILSAAERGTRLEMVLQTEFGLSLQFTRGVSAKGVTAQSALRRARELAEIFQDSDYELRALVGLTMFCVRIRDFQGALVLARQLAPIATATADPIAMGTADSVLGAVLNVCGDLSGALTHAKRAYNQNTPDIRKAQIVRYGSAYSFVGARIVMAQTQWLLGMVDQAAQTARDVVADTAGGDHPLSFIYALTWSLNTLSYGRLETAEPWIASLKDHAGKHAMGSYYACAFGFDGLFHAQRGDLKAGEQLLRACLDGLRQAQYEVLYRRFVSGLAEVLLAADRVEESLAAIDEALGPDQLPFSSWTAEALRIKGEVLLSANRADTKSAEDHFNQSLDAARRQGALFWELRTAMGLGRLRSAQDRALEAYDLLNPVYARFTEGFATADLQAAKRLLEEWTPSDVDKTRS